jgi:WAS/WASL-interacting protein
MLWLECESCLWACGGGWGGSLGEAVWPSGHPGCVQCVCPALPHPTCDIGPTLSCPPLPIQSPLAICPIPGQPRAPASRAIAAEAAPDKSAGNGAPSGAAAGADWSGELPADEVAEGCEEEAEGSQGGDGLDADVEASALASGRKPGPPPPEARPGQDAPQRAGQPPSVKRPAGWGRGAAAGAVVAATAPGSPQPAPPKALSAAPDGAHPLPHRAAHPPLPRPSLFPASPAPSTAASAPSKKRPNRATCCISPKSSLAQPPRPRPPPPPPTCTTHTSLLPPRRARRALRNSSSSTSGGGGRGLRRPACGGVCGALAASARRLPAAARVEPAGKAGAGGWVFGGKESILKRVCVCVCVCACVLSV